MNKKDFETELLTLADKHDVDADEMGVRFFHDVWQWIEQYGKQQRAELIEALRDATLHFPQRTFSKRPCTTCELVTKLFNKPFGCVKELKDG